MLTDAENIVRNYHFYFLPFVFMDRVDSLTTYALISFCHILVGSLTVVVSGSIPLFMITFVGHIHNQFIKLAGSMTYDSSRTVQRVIECEERMRYYNGRRLSVYEIDRTRRFVGVEFGKRCIAYLQTYRNFLQYVPSSYIKFFPPPACPPPHLRRKKSLAQEARQKSVIS